MYTFESTIDYIRYDLSADRWPTDPNEAAVRNGDVFHALAMRGVAHHIALMIAERLEQGDTIEGVEVELVLEHAELEAQMKELSITATCTGGEPRKPFTVDLRPLMDTCGQESAHQLGTA